MAVANVYMREAVITAAHNDHQFISNARKTEKQRIHFKQYFVNVQRNSVHKGVSVKRPLKERNREGTDTSYFISG